MRIEINISEEEARRIKWFLQRRYRKKKTVKLKTLILLAIRTEVAEQKLLKRQIHSCVS